MMNSHYWRIAVQMDSNLSDSCIAADDEVLAVDVYYSTIAGADGYVADVASEQIDADSRSDC